MISTGSHSIRQHSIAEVNPDSVPASIEYDGADAALLTRITNFSVSIKVEDS